MMEGVKDNENAYYNIILKSVQAFSDPMFNNSGIIKWSSPVISFGNIEKAKVATVGLNPSDMEFVDRNKVELKNDSRRFHTLSSLNIEKWDDLDDHKTMKILELNKRYFSNNPYNLWFKKLNYILEDSGLSYYFPLNNACHIDIVPYATSKKWVDLKFEEKQYLINKSKEILDDILKFSNISFLVLNGKSVVENFRKVFDISFEVNHQPTWDLKQNSGRIVKGYSFIGEISSVGDVKLSRIIKIVGYNHNIQSSFGITKYVLDEIKKWITEQYSNLIIYEASR